MRFTVKYESLGRSHELHTDCLDSAVQAAIALSMARHDTRVSVWAGATINCVCLNGTRYN